MDLLPHPDASKWKLCGDSRQGFISSPWHSPISRTSWIPSCGTPGALTDIFPCFSVPSGTTCLLNVNNHSTLRSFNFWVAYTILQNFWQWSLAECLRKPPIPLSLSNELSVYCSVECSWQNSCISCQSTQFVKLHHRIPILLHGVLKADNFIFVGSLMYAKSKAIL
jgi:hypothetical protein